MRRIPLVLLLGLAMASAALACGDENDSETPNGDPLDAYFADLGDIGSGFVDALAAQPLGLDPSAPIAEQVDVYETYSRGLADIIRSARDELDDLEPPAEVAEAHTALLASIENALSVAESLEEELGTINSTEELQRLTDNADVANALQQFQTACLALRDIAAQQDIQRQVRCE